MPNLKLTGRHKALQAKAQGFGSVLEIPSPMYAIAQLHNIVEENSRGILYLLPYQTEFDPNGEERQLSNGQRTGKLRVIDELIPDKCENYLRAVSTSEKPGRLDSSYRIMEIDKKGEVGSPGHIIPYELPTTDFGRKLTFNRGRINSLQVLNYANRARNKELYASVLHELYLYISEVSDLVRYEKRWNYSWHEWWHKSTLEDIRKQKQKHDEKVLKGGVSDLGSTVASTYEALFEYWNFSIAQYFTGSHLELLHEFDWANRAIFEKEQRENVKSLLGIAPSKQQLRQLSKWESDSPILIDTQPNGGTLSPNYIPGTGKPQHKLLERTAENVRNTPSRALQVEEQKSKRQQELNKLTPEELIEYNALYEAAHNAELSLKATKEKLKKKKSEISDEDIPRNKLQINAIERRILNKQVASDKANIEFRTLQQKHQDMPPPTRSEILLFVPEEQRSGKTITMNYERISKKLNLNQPEANLEANLEPISHEQFAFEDNEDEYNFEDRDDSSDNGVNSTIDDSRNDIGSNANDTDARSSSAADSFSKDLEDLKDLES